MRFNGKVITANYTGVVPDTFKNESEVVLKGQAARRRIQRRAQWRHGEVPLEVQRLRAPAGKAGS